ncbi:MAG: carbohydrate kinase [Spirochaetaceae bacterium]|nr:carbohydrate kinase [Spirochaetaceae bacterium]
MIVCCGENLIDMVPMEGLPNTHYGCFKVAPGGCPFNSAIAAARLGADVSFLGKIAGDFLGDKLFGRLAANGVKTGLIRRVPQPVTLAFVERSPEGENKYAFYAEKAADRSLAPGDLPASLPPETHYLLAGSISLVLEPSASTIRSLIERECANDGAATLLSYDPNVRPSLIPDKAAFRKDFESICSIAAIVKASDSDIAWVYDSSDKGSDIDAIVSHILDLGAAAVFLTRGEKGSVAATRKTRVSCRAAEVKVVDTIGAGDTFHAAIVTALDSMGIRTKAEVASLDQETLFALAQFASAASALNCTKEGADPPTHAELAVAFPNLEISRCLSKATDSQHAFSGVKLC